MFKKDSATPADRRRFSRVSFEADAVLVQDAWDLPVHLVDLSVRGILVRPQKLVRPLEVGQPAALVLTLADGTEIAMEVEMIHENGGDWGFRCKSIDLDSAAHLRRLIELNLNCADAADRVLQELLAVAEQN